ncbi:class I SAM-dependent methyltransferase [Algoriphagus sp.]|uniref:class I SAM-dependent methyltransferase n=1 Tax=Algoriphagus sp. TaxID=1872435 RepID=UPI002602A6E1|nr:class I SAM-dependent methyltransferase [Algoriphagus sp.]
MPHYIHGYLSEEQERLLNQAGTLASLIYPWIDFTPAKKLLEIGSGVGAQSKILLELYPQIELTCVELEASQIQKAQANLAGFSNRKIDFVLQDGQQLKLDKSFDSIFICWVLEHVSKPLEVLNRAFAHLDPGGIIYLTEVFNSSFHFLPRLQGLADYYEAYNDYQTKNGGNPDVGLQLGNLLQQSGFKEITLHHGGFHLDQSQPESLANLCDYWKSLMKSAAEGMIKSGLISESGITQMEKDLDQLKTEKNAVFFYQFVQAKAIR